ncbi:MAG: winged helix-turn-helix transcriptional regulator [Acidobacteria bacterium]|nr:winged helix-turn-helix transcriptional regulator [Acidobacteriota bacterium]
MMAPHTGLERRVIASLDATPSRVPVVLGGCGSGRTTLLHALADRLGRTSCQYIDVERSASTPERFHDAVLSSSPFIDPAATGDSSQPTSARDAFDRTLAFLQRARTPDGQAATFLLDEVLELRTFENFPGLRQVLRELVQAIADSPNRFVCSSRYVARSHRVLRDAAARFEVVHLPPLSAGEVAGMLPPSDAAGAAERDELAATVHALGDGRAAYVHALGEMCAAMNPRGGDPISALTALLTTDGALTTWCGYRYELRLHRARGYGALKAILEILAEDEPLTLTEIAQRLRRTPGSTKDYLSWLEDVDLVSARQKRYSFTDPVLRLWVRLHARPMPPGVDEVAHEVQQYAVSRLPQSERGLAAAGANERKPWGIIEID